MEVRDKNKLNTKIFNFSDSNLNLSKIIFGTMRLNKGSRECVSNLSLIENAFEFGINTFHISSEYNSYDLFCDLFNNLGKKRNKFKFIVKLPVPHFEDEYVNAGLIRDRVENYLQDLNIQSIDCVQWILRSKPINDFDRIKVLESYNNDFEEEFVNLKNEGKIKTVLSFPYSNNFANEILKFNFIDGVVNYLNFLELESVDILNSLDSKDLFIAIRPFLAGLFTNKPDDKFSLKDITIRNKIKESLGLDSIALEELALSFPLLHPKVSSVIVSFSSINHLCNAGNVLNSIETDQSKFFRIYSKLKEIE
jgi:aryl-alcohol dehydrogenase-like predicted oxidoreductase